MSLASRKHLKGHDSSVPRSAFSGDPLVQQLGQLAGLLNEETTRLREGRVEDILIYANRKALLLLQLSNQALNPSQRHSLDVRLAMYRVLKELERNHETLKLKLRVLKEISSLLTERMRESESDGTYSMQSRG